ncbi:MAG: TldD/PmbA family protein [Candidatus Diapherotrites archaeon]
MISVKELKAAVEDSLRLIEKKPNVKEAEVFASANCLTVMRLNYASNLPSNALEEPKSDNGFGLSVRVLFKDGKNGFGKEDNDLSRNALLSAFAKAEKDRVQDTDFHSLPSPRGKKKIKNYHDKKIMELDEEKAIASAYACLDGAFSFLSGKKFSENFNITGEADFLAERIAVANSNGVNETDESTAAFASITSIFELERDVAGMWFDSSTHLKNLDAFSAGKIAAEKTYSSMNAKTVESGEYKVVFGRLAVAELFYSRFSVGLNEVDVNASPYVGKLGEKIWSEKLSVSDDALLEGMIGTKAVTDEGIPTGKTRLVEKGVLSNYLSNDYYAKKFPEDKRFNAQNGFRFGPGRHHEISPGINATNVVVGKGEFKEDEELIKEIKDGLYIGRIWYVYPVNGYASADFTGTMRGDSYIVKNGEIVSALVPNTLRLNDNLDRVFSSAIGLSKKQSSALSWGQEAVVLTPEIAVEKLRVQRIGSSD